MTSAEIIDLTTSSPAPISPCSSDFQLLELPVAQQNLNLQQKNRQNDTVILEEGEISDTTAKLQKREKGRRTIKKPRPHQSSLGERFNTTDGRTRQESKRDMAHIGRRSHSGDRTPSTPRRRSHSPRRRRDRSPELQRTDDSLLFTINVTPVPVPDRFKEPTRNEIESETHPRAPDLLLPSHVSVFGSDVVPVEVHSSTNSNENEDENDYIDYLDYDDNLRAGMVRYFDDPSVEAKPTRFVCKHCGAENNHKTRECPVLICLTCGARDEHSTRSCPISKTCYSCGMKGHINRTCPNRYSTQNTGIFQDGCDRCGLISHSANECSTLWRIYEFVTDKEHDTILSARENKRDLPLGKGGEGYIGSDDWCYNCAECGHLGDDCTVINHLPDLPTEPSAFGDYNVRLGPFFDPSTESKKAKRSRARKKRDAEAEGENWGDEWGSQIPTDVGKQGRKKERARLERLAREEGEDDDEDNWFSRKNMKIRGMGQDKREKGKTMNVELAVKDGKKRFGNGNPSSARKSTSPPGLLARLSDKPTRSSFSRRKPGRDRDRDRDRHSHYNGRDFKTRESEREGNRPRWTGGYAT